eukprot:UN10563
MCGRRETIEESGVEVELTGVSHIQHNCNDEYIPLHVVFFGRATGGKLKTFKDSESDRAFWRNFQLVLKELSDDKLAEQYRNIEEMTSLCNHAHKQSNVFLTYSEW